MGRSFLATPVSGFYNKSARRSKYLVPLACEDIDLEIDDDNIEEALVDDDLLGPDFLLDLPDDDLTPTASGKHAQLKLVFRGSSVLFGQPHLIKWTSVVMSLA